MPPQCPGTAARTAAAERGAARRGRLARPDRARPEALMGCRGLRWASSAERHGARHSQAGGSYQCMRAWAHPVRLSRRRSTACPRLPPLHLRPTRLRHTAFLFVSLAHRPRCHSPAPLDSCACMTTAATPAINLTQRRHSLPQLARCAASCCSGRRVLELACRVWLCATPSAAARVYRAVANRSYARARSGSCARRARPTGEQRQKCVFGDVFKLT